MVVSGVIIVIFGTSSYFFIQTNQDLIHSLRQHNIDSSIKAFHIREENSINANKKEMQAIIIDIARHSSAYVKKPDIKGLKKILLFDMKENRIKMVQIWDDELNKLFLVALKKDGKIIFEKQISNISSKFKKLKATINAKNDNEKIGHIVLYYDNSAILKSINTLRKKTLKDIDKFNMEIDKQISTDSIDKFFIYFINLLAILVAITILLKELVNEPLRELREGLDNFFLFLQNKDNNINKITLSSKDEFGQMANSLNNNIEISAKIHEEIYDLNVALQVKSSKERTLLDNAGQGFLTFDKDFMIDSEYSKKCEQLLGSDIASKDIANMLFSNDQDVNQFKSILLDALNIDSVIVQKSMLSLLPNEIILNQRALTLEYKIVKDNKTMLIITNISKQKKLENKIKKEQAVLKMIITVIEDSDTFYEIKKDFEDFARHKMSYINTSKTPLVNINNIYKTIHTFKGLFLQLFMNQTAKQLHNLESQLSKFLVNNISVSNEDISELIGETYFEIFTSSDIETIAQLLGKRFVDNNNLILVDKDKIEIIENQCVTLLESSFKDDKLSEDVLKNIKGLTQRSLKSQLKHYPKLVLQLAQELDKKVYEFEIIGDEDTIVPENFNPFIKSLVHIFRNGIDHGIEQIQERLELDKDEIGTVSCSFNSDDNQLQIIISDDGAGINVENIKMRISKDIDISNLSDEDIYQYIFKDSMSTKDEITEISGRGIGMGVIKQEIEKLNGNIEIQSKLNVGTTFTFSLPIDKKE